MKVRIHVNRRELKKGAKGWPWTVHVGGKCLRARNVELKVPGRAVCEHQRKTNPKCFIVAEGRARKGPAGKVTVTR